MDTADVMAKRRERPLPGRAGGNLALHGCPARKFRLQIRDCLGKIRWGKTEGLVQWAERQEIHGDEPKG